MPTGRATPRRVRHFWGSGASAVDEPAGDRVIETDDELVALGVLDRGAPGFGEQVTLVRLARAYGATVAELRAGIAEHRLHAVAAERVVFDGARLTLRAAAAAAGVDN